MSDLATTDKAIEQASFQSTPVSNPETLQHIVNTAKIMAASGFYPDARTTQQAAAIMLLGQQFGLAPAQAMTGIHVVQGKPMLHYAVILAKVRQHPNYDYEILESTDVKCRIQFLRNGQPCGESVFTDAQAKRQKTQNMDKFPDTMLLARAVSNGVKRFAPDVLNGMPVYTHGEIPDAEYAEVPVSKAQEIRHQLTARAGIEEPVTEAPASLESTLESFGLTESQVTEVLGRCEAEDIPAHEIIAKAQSGGHTNYDGVSYEIDEVLRVRDGQEALIK